MVIWILVLIASCSAELDTELKNSTISWYFLVSRSVLLYCLIEWYMFMFFMVMSSKSKSDVHDNTEVTIIAKPVMINENPNLIDRPLISNQADEQYYPFVRPNVPSIIPESNKYPSLSDLGYDEYDADS